jgi:tRNA(adenine34) deaminase
VPQRRSGAGSTGARTAASSLVISFEPLSLGAFEFYELQDSKTQRLEDLIDKIHSVRKIMKIFLCATVIFLILFQVSLAVDEQKKALPSDVVELEKRIQTYVVDKRYPDDPFILVTVQEALAAIKENNGAVGACLVEESTGKVVERGHNRQFNPYFRSDLHAEMDLLNRYEDRVKAHRLDDSTVPQSVQRKVEGLVLYTSVEPCPMCLSRIINVRLKKTYYAAPDPPGGMAHKFSDLPTFWQELGAGRIFESARCSSELVAIAKALFRPMSKK